MVVNIVSINTTTLVVVTRDNNTGEDIEETVMRQGRYPATDPLASSHHRGWYLSSAPREVTFKQATKWNISYLLDCWFGISSVGGLHFWLLGAPIYLSIIIIETVENIWGVFWIYRNLPRKIQSFGLICVVGDILRIDTTTPLLVTRDNNTGSKRT